MAGLHALEAQQRQEIAMRTLHVSVIIIINIIIIIIIVNSNRLPADDLEIEHVHIAFPVYVADKTFCKCFVID